jgi:hypothetical protein
VNGIHNYRRKWSTSLPDWQSDALRQILEKGEISRGDIDNSPR